MITLTREEAQQVLDALEDAVSCGDFIEVYKNIKEKLNEPMIDGYPLYSGLPQPEPEPVAWFEQGGSGEWFLAYGFNPKANTKPLYTTPPQQHKQEPVAYLCENAVGHKYFRWKKPQSVFKPIALHITPPQREWVGLTDEEIMSLLPGAVRIPLGWENTVRSIEAKLKEKNT